MESLPGSVADVAAAVRSGACSAVEVTAAALAAIERVDPALGAFVEVRPERALAHARALDERLAAGDDIGPLAGVPIGVKDLEDAEGFRTTCGDPTRSTDAPAVADSVEVARLRAAGCIVVGKTNTPAYGLKPDTTNLLFPPTRNPWAPRRSAGGSSGGSGAAVAAGLVPLCTGSDGGGSIRIPSAACGISGFKPTKGVVPAGATRAPMWGVFSTQGPMARTIAEVALALDVVKGFTSRDLYSFDLAGSFVDAAANGSLAGLRLAWSPTLGYANVDATVRGACERAVRAFEAQGATVEQVDTVFTEHPVGAFVARAAPGAWYALTADGVPLDARIDGASQLLVQAGEHTTAEQVIAGEAAAHAYGLRLADLFETYDLLLTPASNRLPALLDEPLGPAGLWAGELTLPFNVTRTPAAVVIAGYAVDDGDELPIGLQLVGPRCADLRVVAAAAAAEEALGLADRRPPLG